MNTNDLNTALYEKMAAEQDKYRDWLKSQPPAEVLNHAYEYTVREDIVMTMEELELTDAQAQALLDSPTPLADVYRYSKKFRQEHEEEILLHQAAKNAFDDMGVKKLPKVKELQAEYARLLEEKKKTYAEYRRSREEMRELLAAKANVDRLMGMEEERLKDKDKDKDKDQEKNR